MCASVAAGKYSAEVSIFDLRQVLKKKKNIPLLQVSNRVATATSCYFSTCIKWIRRTAAENHLKIPLDLNSERF